MFSGILSYFHLAAVSCTSGTGLIPSLYDSLTCDNGKPVLSALSDILTLIANLMRILIAISGSIAIIMILVASVYYIISAGDPAKAKKAKDIIVSTVVGLVLIVAAYAIVTFIAKGF